jgi:hypothetical protein
MLQRRAAETCAHYLTGPISSAQLQSVNHRPPFWEFQPAN